VHPAADDEEELATIRRRNRRRIGALIFAAISALLVLSRIVPKLMSIFWP